MRDTNFENIVFYTALFWLGLIVLAIFDLYSIGLNIFTIY
jgi:hypothetical protein